MPIMGGNKQLAKSGVTGLGSTDFGDDVVMNETGMVLVKMAHRLVETSQINLQKRGTKASGKLDGNIKVKPIQTFGTKKSVDVTLPAYGQFLDKGVRGVNGGAGIFSFKNITPSRKMVAAIERWMRLRGKRVMKYKAISKTERKDKRIKKIKTDLGKQAAYIVARSIKKKGIKPTYFFTDALKTVEKDFKKEIAKGFKADLINTLK